MGGALARHQPALGAQLRVGLYAIAALLLLAVVRFRLRHPSGGELVQLVALSATGLVLFNLLLVEAVRRGDAGSVGVVIGSLPVVLVTVAPLLGRERLRPILLAAAGVVALGAALVQGAGGRFARRAAALARGARLRGLLGCSPGR